MKNIFLRLLDLYSASGDLVLSTITRAKGSTPCKPGSSAIFGRNGLVTGTIGGGLVEAKIQEMSIKSIGSGESSQQDFFLNREVENGEDALCGGHQTILIDARPLDHLDVFRRMQKSLDERKPGVLVTKVKEISGSKVSVKRFWCTENDRNSMPSGIYEKLEPEVRNLLSRGDPEGFSEITAGKQDDELSGFFYLQAIFPQPSLIIAGAGHIGRALAHIGALLDFEVTVIDDRPEYANKENIRDADHIIVDKIGEAVGRFKKDRDTYIVIVTRGHYDDSDALKACIASDAAYIGMIGSRNKVATVRRNFIGNGWATEEQWDRIHAPVGIDIGSETVQEIAVSIAAELIKVKRERGWKN